MPVDSPPGLVDLLARLQLLPPDQQAELTASLQAAFPGPHALAGELVRRGWLTPYQVNQIFLDRAAGLVLGPCVVLDRLGEGGMGEVFKARHQKLGRAVALKLIRKERLAHPDAVRRFYREVQAAAKLEHPHIVRAYDAGEAGGAHFFVMEHVEGTDLARLVKQRGPLPVERACDYARQAALGLQHAFERGLVHRDVKPANLLLAGKGDVVKVLDMGLARLDRPEADAGASATLTQEGAVMGTPDFIAPEQARDSHTADIRADLYSLGCTLYFLLAGRVPFPGGSLTEKLLKHQMDEPRPVEELRPETPPAVAAVVRRLMAKRPEDRYQTPVQAAAALESVRAAPAPASEDTHTSAAGVSPAPRSAGDTLETGATAEVLRRTAERRRRQTARGWRRLALYAVAGLLSLGLGALALVLLIRFALPAPVAPPPVAQTPTPPSPTFEDWLKAVAAMKPDEQVEAVKGELKRRNPKFDGLVKPTVENGVVVGLEFLTDDVTDIAPVRALAGLRSLNCAGSGGGKGRLADLSPLRDMKLTYLICGFTNVSNLAPLKDMPLTTLLCQETLASDLSPLKDMKLTSLNCSGTQVSDLSPLRDVPLANLEFYATQVSDLSPLKDMKLTILNCNDTKVSDLSPLKDMKLTSLNCAGTQVSDLSPLKDMPLAKLEFYATQVSDLSPLKDMKLTSLNCAGIKVSDLSPLKDMKLTSLNCAGTKVWDLSPLKDMPLANLDFYGTQVSDLSPLKGMKLTSLNCGNSPVSELSPLKGMGLTSLICAATPVSDLSPLQGMKLTYLACGETQVSDLSPLQGMEMTNLSCTATKVSSLSPLQGMKLTSLGCDRTQVSDLSPLQGMKLTFLSCTATKVSSLSPLQGMKLTYLACGETRVSDLSPLKGMPLKDLWCDFKPDRDAAILRPIKTLEKINDKPAAEFWKEFDRPAAPKP